MSDGRTGERHPRLSLLVIVSGPERQVQRARAAARAWSASDVEIVEVDGSDGRLPGAVRNAAIDGSLGTLFAIVDGSEQFAPDDIRRACEWLEADTSLAWIVAPGDTGLRLRERDAGLKASLPESVLAGPWFLSRMAIIRRSAFDAVGRYDESLPGLCDWELRLRFIARGVRGALLPEAPGLTDPNDDVVLREALRSERYLPAIRRVLELHKNLFTGRAVALLSARNRLNDALWRRQQHLMSRRDAARNALNETVQEVARLRGELTARGLPAVDWADLRRTQPLSRAWGIDRGRPIDRYYIESFIGCHADEVRGAVLEMLDAGLTTRFGGDSVTRSDVMDIDPGNLCANVIGDLRSAGVLPIDVYDCVILTQTLHLIDDMGAAVREAYRALAPGGVLLATFPSASMFASEYGPTGDHWRLTPAGARWLFAQQFDAEDVTVESYGNVLATTASLYGLCCDDITAAELDANNPDYPLIVAVRAAKPLRPRGPISTRCQVDEPAILLYHRAASPLFDPFSLAVRPDYLREQLQVLRERFTPMRLSDLAEAARTGSTPARAVALTFDDGYIDALTVVAPMLAEFEIPATFFLTTESLNRSRAYWWDVLAWALAPDAVLPTEIVLMVDGRSRTFATGHQDARRQTLAELHALLAASRPAVRDDVMRGLRAATSPRIEVDGRPLLAGEIAMLAGRPFIDIGAHSVHHLALIDLDDDERHREIFECRTTLERAIGRAVTLFAYPFGHWSSAVCRTVVEADYSFAVTCDARRLRPHEVPHALPRLQAPNVPAADFEAWLSRPDSP